MTMLGMKPHRAAVEQMIAEIDTDGNGNVDFEEFLMVIISQPLGHMSLMLQQSDVRGFIPADHGRPSAAPIHKTGAHESIQDVCGRNQPQWMHIPH